MPYGTHAWSKSYGRRSIIELLNKLLKVDEGLGDNAFMCAFGLGAHELAAIILCVAHNVEVATRFSEDKAASERDDEELPLFNQSFVLPNDSYFSGRLPVTGQNPPGDPPPE